MAAGAGCVGYFALGGASFRRALVSILRWPGDPFLRQPGDPILDHQLEPFLGIRFLQFRATRLPQFWLLVCFIFRSDGLPVFAFVVVAQFALPPVLFFVLPASRGAHALSAIASAPSQYCVFLLCFFCEKY